MGKISSFLDNTYTKILLGATCVVLLIMLFMQRTTRQQFKEVQSLPFHNTQMEVVQDGTYKNALFTSFLKVEVEVTVQNHTIKDIKILNQQGAQEGELEEYAKEMVSANSSDIPMSKVKNARDINFPKIVFISCVDSALYMGVDEKDKNPAPVETKDDKTE